MSSLDGAMKVYPIQLSPLDWFEGLSTSFTMEDLTQDPEVIRMQIDAKSQQLDTLNTQLVALQMGTTGDPTDLEKKVAAAQTSLDAAQSALSQAYSNNVIEMANTCLDAAGKVDTSTLAGKLKMAQSALANLPAMMDKVKAAQDNLTSSSRALSQMMSALALAQATDTKQQQQQLTLQIQSITGDLKELRTRWQMLTSTTGGVALPAPVDNSGVPAPDIQLPQQTTSGGSRWQTIQFTSSSTTRQAVASANSEASVGLLVVIVLHTHTQ
jgi:polyhydroxyalkanoate synthesis regulator phasin